MIDLNCISDTYETKRLYEEDAEKVLHICQSNPQFYLYSAAECSVEQIIDDMHACPPGITENDKYYFGFFEEGRLIAVMDLIDGYPDAATAFIGFFMMAVDRAGKGCGTAIIARLCAYLKTAGFKTVRLCIDQGNPQSAHFWHKNGFQDLREALSNDHPVILAEKKL